MLEQIFNTVLNMSITGAYIILAVILIRLLLRKAPKIFSYILWIIPALRLIFPFSFSSVLSVFNLFSVPTESSDISGITTYDYVPQDIGTMPIPEVSTGINAADNFINSALPSADITASANPMQIVTAVASVVWITGIIGMLTYGIVSFVKIKKRIEFATKVEVNIFECEKIRSPFVLGIIKPRVYLPCGMTENREYVICHEQIHIKRFDHISKLLAFAVLAVHWFNPLVWIAFNLMTRDMEMSCDEKVLNLLGAEAKKDYGMTLVSIGANKRFIAAAPLSFGENGVEERVVNVLKFKKPKVIAVVLCVILCVAAGIVCLTNAATDKDKYSDLEEKIENYIVKRDDSAVAAVEIVEMTEDNTAYCWMQILPFDYSYASYLDGSQQSELLEFRAAADALFAEAQPLVSQPYAAPLMLKAKFNDSMVVTEIERIDTAPVDMGDETEYAEIIWNKIADKAAEKYENAYEGKYRLTRAWLKSPYEQQSNLYAMDFELVQYLGKPTLVMKVTNKMKAYNTLQIPYYRIDGNFTMRMNDAGSESEGIELVRDPDKSYDTPRYSIAGGSESGKEYLCIYDLSPFIDTIEKNKSYTMFLNVETPFGETVEATVNFQVSSNTLFNLKPTLTYESLASGNAAPITEKIGTPVYGWITQGFTNPISYSLSEEDLKTIVKCFNQTKLTEGADIKADELYLDDAFCVQIRDKDAKTHSFIAASLDYVLDSEQNIYTAENAELFKTVADIYTEKQGEAYEATTAAPAKPEYNAPQTKPSLPYSQNSYTEREKIYTGIAQTSPEAQAETQTYFALDDITAYTSSNISGIELLGIAYETSYSDGPHFLLNIINKSDSEYYVKNFKNSMACYGYTLERQSDGQWHQYKATGNKSDNTTAQIYKNVMFTTLLPINKYLTELENGRYRISLPIYESEQTTGSLMIEFSVTKYIAETAQAGSKIENATSVVITPASSGIKYVFTQMSDEQRNKIVAYYNGFDLAEGQKPNSSAADSVYITDSKGNLHWFMVYSDGTVWQNRKFYKPANGKAMYELLKEIIGQ